MLCVKSQREKDIHLSLLGSPPWAFQKFQLAQDEACYPQSNTLAQNAICPFYANKIQLM